MRLDQEFNKMEQRENLVSLQRENGFLATGCLVLYGVCFVFLSMLWTGLVAVMLPSSVVKAFPALFYIVVEAGILISAVVPAYVLLVYVEKRPVSDLGLTWRRQEKPVWHGLLFVIFFYMAGFGVSLLLDAVRIIGIHFRPFDLLFSFLFFVLVAFAEEIMVRGYILGCLLRTGMNRFLALAISSVIFALLHVFNPSIAFLPMLNLVLAGVLLGSVYLYTRNLWLSISLHLFWNWIQGPVLGYEVSGNNFHSSLLILRLPGPNLLSGGAFGFEGSLICTILMVIAIAGIIGWYEKRWW